MKQVILWTLALLVLALGIWRLVRPGAHPAPEPAEEEGALEGFGRTAQETMRRAQEGKQASEERARAANQEIGKAEARPGGD